MLSKGTKPGDPWTETVKL